LAGDLEFCNQTGVFMSYSVIGSGNIGSAVARQFVRQGIDIGVANTRGPDSLSSLRKELGSHVIPQTLEAASQANVVILAAPFSAVAAIAGSSRSWAGKIVIDAMNAIDFPSFAPTNLGGRPSSELVAEQLHGARVVKAFNTLAAADLASEPIENNGHRVLFISGNDTEANFEVSALVERLGFAPILLGRLAEGGLLQQFGGPLAAKNLVKFG
jgi:8-hydroxy-5-deazaflavin:NADPH oxidoreductase